MASATMGTAITDAKPSKLQRAPGLRRSGSIKSSAASVTSTKSVVKNKDYWNNLMCLFTGIGTNPQARGATSLNNKDHFPGNASSAAKSDDRPQSPRPSTARPSTSSKRSGSFLSSTPSTNKKRNSSRTSFFSRKASRNSIVEEPAVYLRAVPETDVLSDMASDANPEALSRLESHQRTTSTSSTGSDNLVAVMKDGQTHWIPEHIISQYLGNGTTLVRPPSPTSQFIVPRRSSLRRSRRPGMRISIPSNHFAQLPPEAVCTNAVPLGRQISRPVHPLERNSFSDQTPPSLASDRSSSVSPYSENVRSPGSQYDSGTSQSSFELQTPKDASPVSPIDNKYFSVFDPARQGVFDENSLLPQLKDLNLGEVQTPIAPTRHHQRQPLLTPTPSEAITELEKHLGTSPISPNAPPVPQRSGRRTTTQVAMEKPKLYTGLAPTNPYSDAVSINEMSLALSPTKASNVSASDPSEPIGTDAAESVILAILSAIDNPADLFNCALLNKGFYGVYKRHELQLIREAFRRSNPAAAECREVGLNDDFLSSLSFSFDDHADVKKYLKGLKRDAYIITAVKSLILRRCRDRLRPDMVAGLRGLDSSRRQAADKALWRIWSFCGYFGSRSGKQMNVEEQIGWLRGGHRSRREGKQAAVFGSGNGDGLRTSELKDMMELWECLQDLLAPIGVGTRRLQQARSFGVFAHQDVNTSEDVLLREWVSHLMSLGPAVVLDLATPAISDDEEVFSTAHQNGWTKWNFAPSPLGIHCDFFAGAVQAALADRRRQRHARKSAHKTAAQIKHSRPSTKKSPVCDDDDKTPTAERPRPHLSLLTPETALRTTQPSIRTSSIYTDASPPASDSLKTPTRNSIRASSIYTIVPAHEPKSSISSTSSRRSLTTPQSVYSRARSSTNSSLSSENEELVPEKYTKYRRGLTPGERLAFDELVGGRRWNPETARLGIMECRRLEGTEGRMGLVERVVEVREGMRC